jgi:hypothetical protein
MRAALQARRNGLDSHRDKVGNLARIPDRNPAGTAAPADKQKEFFQWTTI